MTRAEKIKAGKLWQVHAPPDTLLFEGSRTACLKWLRTNGKVKARKRWEVVLGRLIWEPEP